MKYIVEVNAKWLVSVEADSLLKAEHNLLDYNGIWGAMAYDREMMKTDTFMGAVQSCGMVSMDELVTMINAACDAKLDAVKKVEAANDADKKVKELEKMLAEAKKAQQNAKKAQDEAAWILMKAEEKLGKERY